MANAPKPAPASKQKATPEKAAKADATPKQESNSAEDTDMGFAKNEKGAEILPKKLVAFGALLAYDNANVDKAAGGALKSASNKEEARAEVFAKLVGVLDGKTFVNSEDPEGKYIRMSVQVAQTAVTTGEGTPGEKGSKPNGIKPVGNAVAAVVMNAHVHAKYYDKAASNVAADLDKAATAIKTKQGGGEKTAAELTKYNTNDLEAIKSLRATLDFAVKGLEGAKDEKAAEGFKSGIMAMRSLLKGQSATQMVANDLIGGKESRAIPQGADGALWALTGGNATRTPEKILAALKNQFFVPQREVSADLSKEDAKAGHDKNRWNIVNKALLVANLFSVPADKDANKAFTTAGWAAINEHKDKAKETKRAEEALKS